MYASRTGTTRNLDAMQGAGWRLLVEPGQLHRYQQWPPLWTDGQPVRYCVDNGAWSAHQQGVPFDGDAFSRFAELLCEGADFTVVPDIVGGGLESLEFSLGWLPKLSGLRLIGVQDGMTAEDVRPHLGPSVGIAVGGTTEPKTRETNWSNDLSKNWKERTLPMWGRLAREAGCFLHVLRVNSVRRVKLCQDAGAHSCDGTSVTKHAVNLPKMNNAANQLHLWGSR